MRYFLSCVLAFCGVVAGAQTPTTTTDSWRAGGQAALKAALAKKPNPARARNVIIFLGDGMSVATINAARIYEGQAQGGKGEEHQLAFEKFPFSGMVKTYNTDAMVPDSAGTMSAIMTGVKTKAGVISQDDGVTYGRCEGAEAHRAATALELAEREGKATGVITTARLTHATPAATYAHSADREWESDRAMNDDARAKGCVDIARQLVDFSIGDGLDVALGGGRENFIAANELDAEYPDKTGARADKQNLVDVWQRRHPQGKYVWNREQFMALDFAHTKQILGLFEPSHMRYESERASANEPSLTEMTQAAITRLKQHKKGFFLVVEGARIDHANHAGNARNALNETVEFARAVQKAVDLTSEKDTLIIVTADHGHTLSLAGDDVQRGNPILGLAHSNESENEQHSLRKDLNGKPFTVLNYLNGPGFGHLNGAPKTSPERPDLSHEDTSAWTYRQEALIPLKSETHSGEDVVVYARGPWSQLFTGSMEQNALFHFYRHAMQVK